MRSTKFSSCSDVGSCCEPGGIPIPELVGHLLLSLSQCPAQGILSGSESSALSWTHRLHPQLLRLQGGLVWDPQTNRDTSTSQGGEEHSIRTCTFEQPRGSVPLLQQRPSPEGTCPLTPFLRKVGYVMIYEEGEHEAPGLLVAQ